MSAVNDGRFETVVPGGAATPARLPDFAFLAPGVDPAGVLGGLSIVVLGCGAVGRAFAEGVVRLGPGRLDLVDPDRYSAANVGSQPISPAEIGRPKALSTAEALRGVHAGTEIRVFEGRVEELREDALADCDIVFVATDNLQAEQDIARRCVALGRKLIQGSVYGTMMVAHVRLLRHLGDDAPCLVCAYTEADFQHAAGETKFSCTGPVAGERPDVLTMPTMSIAALSAMAANLAVIMVVRLALELGDPIEDCLVEFSGYTGKIVTSPLARNPHCPADHTRWSRRTYPGDLARATLRQVADAAGFDVTRSDGALSVRVDEYAFAPYASCACPDPSAFNRYVGLGAPIRRCDRCDGGLTADRFSQRNQVAIGLVERRLDRPLESLGAVDVRYAVVGGPDRVVFLRPDGVKEQAS